MKSNLKIFVLKVLMFFVIIAVTDFIIGYALKIFYSRQQSGPEYLTSYALNEAKADILILGSSRAVNIYNTMIFEKQCNMSCYNAGRYGYPIFYHYAILKGNLQRHTPKIVILSFDASNFSINQGAYDKLNSLLPYYRSHPEIRSVLDLKGKYQKIKMLSSIYPYNSMLLDILTGYTEWSKKKFATIKGYIPLKTEIKGPLKSFDYTREMELDTIKINTYKSFLKLCKAANIKLYVVCPPYLVNSTGTDLSILEAIKINREFGVPFLDYSRDTFYTSKPHLFYDFRHLNEKGVEIFSKTVSDSIRNLSVNKPQ